MPILLIHVISNSLSPTLAINTSCQLITETRIKLILNNQLCDNLETKGQL